MSATEVELEIIRVPIGALIPNPWNPNVLDSRTRAALNESLDLYGAIDPVTCRPHPETKDAYEILDGEHRWQLLVERGATEIDIVSRDLNDAQSRKLTIIMNETRGQADTVPLALLLAELEKDTTLDELILGLPYERKQLDELLKIGQIDWDTFNSERAGEVEDHIRLSREKNQYTVFLNFDKGQKEKYDTYTSMLAREKNESYTVEQAVIDGLAAICQKL